MRFPTSLLLIPLLFTGCIHHRDPDFVSSNGVMYLWEGDTSWEPEMIEKQENWFIEQLADAHRYDPEVVMNHLKFVLVQVYPDKIACGIASPTGFCNGEEIGRILYVRNMGCPYNSALTHEFTHLLQAEIDRILDYDHTDKPLWAIGDGSPESCPNSGISP